jgi:hypothetical protein
VSISHNEQGYKSVSNDKIKINGESKMKKQTELQKAVKVLIQALKDDKELRMGWIANIAVPFQDCISRYKKANNKRELNQAEIHKISNEAADEFISNLCR